ncbi:hypothetical protein [Sneathia sanguinegens]|jgi:hypothetical protein|uniref:hypothetical protein n=1 Tax=Sneathia sanguinegens TaxID=40543 RepID=UPI00258C5C39|nr:hypothetical protein [Sneathia sanguinegens]MDU4652154.1 hypothetical protein [Sneathia sanguinegens]
MINFENYIEYRKVFILKFLNSNEKKINYSIENNLENIEKYFKTNLKETDINKLKKYEKIIDKLQDERYVVFEDDSKMLWKDFLFYIRDKVDELWDNEEERKKIKERLSEDQLNKLNVGELKKQIFRKILINCKNPVIDVYGLPYTRLQNLIFDKDKKNIIKKGEQNE